MLFRRFLIAALIVAAIALQVRLWFGEGSFAQVAGLKDQVESKEARILGKEERNRILLAETRELKTGLETIEELARTELGMIKSSETFYLIVEEDASVKDNEE